MEHPLLFYPRRIWDAVTTHAAQANYWLWLERLRKRVERTPNAAGYTDDALAQPGSTADSNNVEAA